MTLAVVKASGELLDRLFRFRHQIYVEELGDLALATKNYRLEDRYDDRALNYAAIEKEQVVGSFRVNHLNQNSHWQTCLEQYDASHIVEHAGRNASIVCGRLAVSREGRSAHIMARLVTTALQEAINDGVRLALAECSPSLLSVYTRLGWMATAPSYYDATSGLKVPIFILTRDQQHFRRLSSPFLKVAENHDDDVELRQFRISCMPMPSIDRIGLSGSDERVAAVTCALSKIGTTTRNWIDQLSSDELKKRFRRADIFGAREGQVIFNDRIHDSAVYVAVSSALDVIDAHGDRTILSAGTPFTGLQQSLPGVIRVRNATMLCDSELFVFPAP